MIQGFQRIIGPIFILVCSHDHQKSMGYDDKSWNEPKNLGEPTNKSWETL